MKPLPEDTCNPSHDAVATTLTAFLCVGLVLSYLPQHLRIIKNKTSEGLSPWYLLLGSTSSASAMLNLFTVQWGVVRCCKHLSAGRCLESLGGIIQVTIQWTLFTVILVLFLIYFPPHIKYAVVQPLSRRYASAFSRTASRDASASPAAGEDPASENGKTAPKVATTAEWRLAVTLAWVVAIHLALGIFITLLLTTSTPSFAHPSPALKTWAAFLGLSATLLATLQYAPQIQHTFRTRLVGALSIPTMAIQVPGSVIFVLSIALREGTDWTSWLPYAVTGVLQGSLLGICVVWKGRQRRLGVDDFGRRLDGRNGVGEEVVGADERTPLVREGAGEGA